MIGDFMKNFTEAYRMATGEELKSAAAGLADLVSSYYRSLLDVGMGENEALRLTIEFQNWNVIAALNQKKDEPK